MSSFKKASEQAFSFLLSFLHDIGRKHFPLTAQMRPFPHSFFCAQFAPSVAFFEQPCKNKRKTNSRFVKVNCNERIKVFTLLVKSYFWSLQDQKLGCLERPF